MMYPYKAGIWELSENDTENYENKEHEYLVIVKEQPKKRGFSGSEVIVTLLGAVDITENRQFSDHRFITWTATPWETETPKGAWPHLHNYSFCFEEHKVYRVTGLPAKEGAPATAGLFKLRSILSDNEHDSFLEGIMAEYYKPIFYDSAVLGQLIYNKKYSMYEGKFNWLGTVIDISMEVPPEYAGKYFHFLEDLCRESAEWDKRFKEAIGDQLTELANYWLDDSGNETISREDFVARQEISSIEMGESGKFAVWYKEEEIFGDHSVKLWCDTESGEIRATMEG